MTLATELTSLVLFVVALYILATFFWWLSQSEKP